MTPGIGVCMPTHPGRDPAMLARAISSVWSQTRPAAHLSVAVDLERRGAGHTRQRALDGNPCEWTAFLDSDDYLGPDHLQVLADAAEETGADYVYSWYWLEHMGTVLSYDPVFPSTHFTEPWNPDDPRQTTVTVLVRTELARQVGYWSVTDEAEFPDGLRQGEDWHFTLGCNRLGKIHHVAQRTWYWTHHGLNTSGRPGQGDAR